MAHMQHTQTKESNNMVENKEGDKTKGNTIDFNQDSKTYCETATNPESKAIPYEDALLQETYEQYVEENEEFMAIRKKNLQALLGMLKMKSMLTEEQTNKPRMQKTDFQKAVLKEIFDITKFPSRQTREYLALLLKHSARGIQIWFQNQRNKLLIYEQGQSVDKKERNCLKRKRR